MTGKKINVLIVVKSNYHAVLISHELKSRYGHYNDFVCYSLYEAQEILRIRDIKAVIIDLDLFEGQNIQMVKSLYVDNPTLIIVGMTSDKTGVTAKYAKEFGIYELVCKDDSFQVIISKLVEKLLTREKLFTAQKIRELKLPEDATQECIKTASRTLSHEILNPLMTILGTTELILDESYKHDEKLIEKIKIIKIAANRIKNTTQRLTKLDKPVFQQTVTGMLVDPNKSSISEDEVLNSTK